MRSSEVMTCVRVRVGASRVRENIIPVSLDGFRRASSVHVGVTECRSKKTH